MSENDRFIDLIRELDNFESPRDRYFYNIVQARLRGDFAYIKKVEAKNRPPMNYRRPKRYSIEDLKRMLRINKINKLRSRKSPAKVRGIG